MRRTKTVELPIESMQVMLIGEAWRGNQLAIKALRLMGYVVVVREEVL